jgi:hypothetical protein
MFIDAVDPGVVQSALHQSRARAITYVLTFGATHAFVYWGLMSDRAILLVTVIEQRAARRLHFHLRNVPLGFRSQDAGPREAVHERRSRCHS